jgi:hypothetical protein
MNLCQMLCIVGRCSRSSLKSWNFRFRSSFAPIVGFRPGGDTSLQSSNIFCFGSGTTPTVTCRELVSTAKLSRCFSSSKSRAMANTVDTAIEIYRRLSRHPSVKSGRISMEDAPGHLQIYSEWSQRDLTRSENTKFARGHIIQLDVVIPTPSHQVSDELWNKESPSGRLGYPMIIFEFPKHYNMTNKNSQ